MVKFYYLTSKKRRSNPAEHNLPWPCSATLCTQTQSEYTCTHNPHAYKQTKTNKLTFTHPTISNALYLRIPEPLNVISTSQVNTKHKYWNKTTTLRNTAHIQHSHCTAEAPPKHRRSTAEAPSTRIQNTTNRTENSLKEEQDRKILKR